MPYPKDTRTLAERLEAYSNRSGGPDACWEWTKNRAPRGYGRLNMNGRVILAHRASWSVANGREPAAGLFICHKCDNPACINPAHLFEGTHGDNMRDMFRKGRMHQVRPYVAGDKSGQAKLTGDIVVACRKLARQGIAVRELARMHGVHRTSMERAVRGETWSTIDHLEAPCRVSDVVGNSAITKRWRARQRREV